MSTAPLPLATLALARDADVVEARRRARELAGLLGLDAQDGVRLATAVSEVARNALQYAGGGRVELLLGPAEGGAPAVLLARVSDAGPGLARPEDALTSPGQGLAAARRLLDVFELQTGADGTRVLLGKRLPRSAPAPTPERLAQVAAALARGGGPAEGTEPDLQAELQAQHRELLRTLAELRQRQDELAEASRELEETNRGVVALYAELDARAEMAARASETKSRFLSHMSHEFRTPLGAVRTLAQLLLDQVDGPLTDEQQKQVRLIHGSSSELLGLVDDLLDLAKVEAGKASVHAAPFELADLFASLRTLLRPLARNPDVELVFEEPPPDAPRLFTDEAKVSQVLRNFISNALKFTERGEVRVAVAPGAAAGTWDLRVSDTGVGIAPEDQERVFEEFFQAKHPLQRRVKGTGLGLPLTRKLAELLGGRVTLQSAPGRGSTFTLAVPGVLPGAEAEAATVLGAAARQAGGPGAPAARTVLVVDDDAASRYLLRRHLEALGLAVREADGGRAALAALQETGAAGLAGVLLDLRMPDLPGWDVLEALRAQPATARLPVLLVTGEALERLPASRLARADGVLAKEALGRGDAQGAVRAALERAGVLQAPATAAADGRRDG